MTALIASGCAFIGTFVQFGMAIQQLAASEKETFRTIDDWRSEFSWRNPIRRRRHRKELQEVLDAYPTEAATYKRVERLLLSWSLLVVGAGIAVAASIANVFSN